MTPLASRRSFIKGLPLSLAGLAASSPFWDRLISSAAAQTVTQKRFLVFFVPDGLVPEWFWHDQTGTLNIRSDRAQDAELSGTSFSTTIPRADWPTFVLQPLAAYSKQILLAKGINNNSAADHVPALQAALTGNEPSGKDESTGPSIDAVMAAANKTSRHIVPVFRTGVYVKQTKLSKCGAPFLDRSGTAYIEPSSSVTTDARVMLDAVSGRATATPGTAPRPATDNSAQLKSKTRVAELGAVKARIDALKCTAGTAAAQRLEGYIADLARIEKLEQQLASGMAQVATSPFSVAKSLDPNDATIKTHENDIRHLPTVSPFLRELAVTALALDYAPAVTLQYGATGVNKISGNTLTDYRYDFLPNFENKGAGEHGLAHPQDTKFIAAGFNISGASSTRDRVRMRRWVFNELRLLVDRLASAQDGDGSLLDNTTILYASEFGGPNANTPAGQHSTRNLPYMLIGGKNSPFNLGQGMNVSRSHGDYLYTLAKGFGSSVTSVGKGKATIDGILK